LISGYFSVGIVLCAAFHARSRADHSATSASVVTPASTVGAVNLPCRCPTSTRWPRPCPWSRPPTREACPRSWPT